MSKRAVFLEVDGLEIAGEIYIPEDAKMVSRPTLCLCHGIPAVPPDPNDRGYPILAGKFRAAGMVTMLFNFRGTGGSGGNLDILGWARDLKAVIDYLYSLREVDRDHLSLMGFSGGAAVAAYVASQDPRVSSIVTCACPAEFSFLTNVEQPQSIIEHFRHIGVIRDNDFPPSIDQWLGGFDQISPINWVDKIAPRPLLLIHGEQDELVNVSHAWALYEKAGQPKEIAIIDGAEHRIRHDEKAMATALNWLMRRSSI